MRTQKEIDYLSVSIRLKLGRPSRDIDCLEKCLADLEKYSEDKIEPSGGHNPIRLWLLGDVQYSPIDEMVG